MDEIFRRILELWPPTLDNVIHLADILLVAYVVYRLLVLIRSTRAWRILIGIVIFVVVLFLSDFLGLRTLHWVLDKATLLAPVALVILFLPELRQTLESFAKIGLPERSLLRETAVAARTVEEVVAAVAEMAASRIGAIIVFERAVQLNDIAANGVQVHSEVSAPLLGSIFYHGNPLHDGAVLLRGDRLVAAACRLPLSDSQLLDQSVHMRHRAGLGLSEQADCVVVIVSEERGSISLAINGSLVRLSDHIELRDALNRELRGTHTEARKPRGRRRREKTEVGA